MTPETTITYECTLQDLKPIHLNLVNGTEDEALWDQLVREHHYLGYKKMFGPRVKYLAKAGENPIAAISYIRAVLRVAARDCFVGWNEVLKSQYLHQVLCQNRFLILPWVKVKNLASYLLAKSTSRLTSDWYRLYGATPFLVETFVDIQHFSGTCYKAAGWEMLGHTKGFSKTGEAYQYHGCPKQVFVKILDPSFRNRLGIMPRPLPMKKQGRDHQMLLSKPDYDPEILKNCGLSETDITTIAKRLKNHLDAYNPCYKRNDQKRLTDTFIKGLLSDLDRKSIEPIALRYSNDANVRSMQMFFKQATIDDEQMLRIYQKKALALVGESTGMLNVDGSDFPKKGKNSVGVIRQHCGVLGKTENCQAGVFFGYSSSKGYCLLDRRLYMPKQWFTPEYESLRHECAVPENLSFQTKNQLALDMIHDIVNNSDVPYQWIGCDSAFGADRSFLTALPQNCYYFADVRADTLVFDQMPQMQVPVAAKSGRPLKYPRPSFQPIRVDAYAQDESIPWQQVVLAEGAKGPIIADVKCLRVVGCSSATKLKCYMAPADWVWLYIRRFANGRIKYSLCNAPEDTPLDTLNQVATMRWPIEQCFEECKSHLGMGHYETRSYRAWYRHMLFVMMAHLFTLSLRLLFKKNDCTDNAHGEIVDFNNPLE